MPDATIPVIFLTSFAVGFSGAITPGPLLVYSIREALRIGFLAGPLVVLGHALLELAVVIALALGVASFLGEGTARAVITTAGGLVLLWMGWSMVKHPASIVLPQDQRSSATAPAAGRHALFTIIGGAVVSLSNPFWSLWWATIGLSYIVWAGGLGAAGVASLYTGHILSDLVWYGLVALAIASGRRVMPQKAYRLLVLVCGLFLLGLGAFFLTSGAQMLAGTVRQASPS